MPIDQIRRGVGSVGGDERRLVRILTKSDDGCGKLTEWLCRDTRMYTSDLPGKKGTETVET